MPSRDTAQEFLAPYEGTLRECIEAGFEAWRQFGRLDAKLRQPLDNRARACFIFSHIVFAVRQRFAETRGVRIMQKRGFPELVIKGRYVIRFKKLDSRGRARNFATTQNRLWFEQHAELPEMPPRAVRLVAGYVLDLLGTQIERVLVICPINASAVEWRIDLREPGDATVIDMPRPIRKPKSPTVRSTKERKSEKDADSKE